MNSLKNLVLSMHFLETNNVVGVEESFEIFEFEFSVPLFGETDPTRPLVFQVMHRKTWERKEPHPSHPVVRCSACGGA